MQVVQAAAPVAAAPAPVAAAPAAAPAPAAPAPAAAAPAAAPAPPKVEGVEIASPMSGTMYRCVCIFVFNTKLSTDSVRACYQCVFLWPALCSGIGLIGFGFSSLQCWKCVHMYVHMYVFGYRLGTLLLPLLTQLTQWAHAHWAIVCNNA